jgi:hypothetical protein
MLIGGWVLLGFDPGLKLRAKRVLEQDDVHYSKNLALEVVL